MSSGPFRATSRRWPFIGELAVPFILFLTLYVVTLSETLAISHDSISYVNVIDAATDLYHPHHLLYFGLAAAWAAGGRFLGVSQDTIQLVSVLNALFGTLTLCVFYSILRRRLGFDRLRALLGTTLPAFSFGFWFYSVTVEVYIIPLFFLFLCIYLISANGINVRRLAAVGFTHGVAVLFHQVHILFTPVILLVVFLRYRREPLRFLRSTISYGVTLASTAVIPYLIVMFGLYRFSSLTQAWSWLTLYAQRDEFWYPVAWSTLFKVGVGFGRALIGFHFGFAILEVRKLIQRAFPNQLLMDENFLVRNLDEGVAYLLLGLSAALALLVLTHIVVRLVCRYPLGPEQRKLVPPLVTWVSLYSIFFFFWVPSNIEFWIPQSVVFWLLFLMLCVAPRAQGTPRSAYSLIGLGSLSLLTFLPNFVGSIRFTQDSNNDYYRARISPFVQMAGSDDLVIIGRSWILRDYLLKYVTADVLTLVGDFSVYNEVRDPALLIRRVQGEIEHKLSSSNRVFISEEAVALEPLAIELLGRDAQAVERLWQGYRDMWRRLDYGSGTIYILEPRRQ